MYVGICCTAHNNDALTATDLRFYYTGSFADYNSSYVYVAPIFGPTLTPTLSGGNISISWAPAGGHIESTAALGAGAIWTSNGVANPYITPASGPEKFFRVVVP
jgi:hypothetical protein